MILFFCLLYLINMTQPTKRVIALPCWPGLPSQKWGLLSNKNNTERMFWTIYHLIGTVLDVGCEYGYLTIQISRYHQVLGIDIDPSCLAIALQGVESCNSSAEICMDPIDIRKRTSFQDRKFDTILLAEVIEHIEPQYHQAVMEESMRLCKKRLIVTTPCEGRMMPEKVKSHVCNLSQQQMLCLVTDSEFDVEHHRINETWQAIIADRKDC